MNVIFSFLMVSHSSLSNFIHKFALTYKIVNDPKVLTATTLSQVLSLIGLQYLYMYQDCIEFNGFYYDVY